MNKSLLFIPDISGFTNFVQTTEVLHSEHVIAELLEVLIDANTESLRLAEVEGDALFFYKEGTIPSQEKLLAQIESIYTAFYSHLKMIEKNRICPCRACASAPNLELKIILHCGRLQFMTVKGDRKPFGESVIQAHRLLKNTIDSSNYVMISKPLSEEIQLRSKYQSKLFNFFEGENLYDEKLIKYLYSEIDVRQLRLHSFSIPEIVKFNRSANFSITKEFKTDAYELFETITNYRYRPKWVGGIDEFQFKEYEVTRQGTNHVCVIDGKHLNFSTVIKEVPLHKLVYGELTKSHPMMKKLYQFYIIEPLNENNSRLTVELYWQSKTIFHRLIIKILGIKKQFKSMVSTSTYNLNRYLNERLVSGLPR